MSRFRLQIKTGGATAEFAVPAPLLDGAPDVSLQFPAGEPVQTGRFATLQSDSFLVGWGSGEAGAGLEESASDLYRQMFRALDGRFLYRVWHFIPQINGRENGLENYRVFCRARATALEEACGENWQAHVPAASAVGTEQEQPTVFFIGGRAPFQPFENPEQTPAFRYPPAYGPRPPGFARACRTVLGGREIVFVSGTASIKRSETVHANDCLRQTETTLDNLSLISRASGLDSDFGSAQGAERHFVIYLRRNHDLPKVKELLENRLFLPGDRRTYLRADICRADLSVEIEATVLLPC